MLISEFVDALAGASPAEAGGLAAMISGAAGAALYAKCRYRAARPVMVELQELAAGDGGAFAGYLQARRSGEAVEPWLRQATECPFAASSLCLNLVGAYALARQGCPRSMVADLLAGRALLLAAAQSCLYLVEANLRLFPQPWSQGEQRLEEQRKRLLRFQESDRFQALFARTGTIAVVGIGDNPEKPAYYVPEYLKTQGFRILGIHPQRSSPVADSSAATLAALDEPVDLVIFFRRSESLPQHLDEVLAMSPLPDTVWLQQGIEHRDFARSLSAVGVNVVSDRCAKEEHQALTAV